MGDRDDGQRELHHRYDWAMRSWAESNLAGVASWLDPSLSGLPAEAFVKRPTALRGSEVFNGPLMHADLVVSVGSERLMHVEYETSPQPDFAQRMLEYRTRIMGEYPGVRLTQHVIVLGDGRAQGYDDVEAYGIALELHRVYLREHDPAEYLKDPLLALFAVLARGSRREREQSLGAAMRLLRDSGHPLASRWYACAKTVAGIRLDGSTINRIEKESMMDLHPTVVDFFREQKCVQRMVEEGKEQGKLLTRERFLLVLLRTRFGDCPDAEIAARRLVDWDEEAAIAAITAAADVASLLSAQPPMGLRRTEFGSTRAPR